MSQDLEDVAKILGDFFKDEPEKITHWLFTYNPHLGGTPARLIIARPEKAAKIIRSMHGGDFP